MNFIKLIQNRGFKMITAVGITFAAFLSAAVPTFAAVHVAAYSSDAVFRYLDVCLDTICIILMLIAVVFILQTIREYKKSSISIACMYFFIGTLILGAIRIFFILVDDDIWSLHDVTLTIGWEILFLFSMVIFFIAGRSLAHLVNMNGKKASFSTAFTWLIASFLLTALIFACAPLLDRDLVMYVQNSWFYTFGVLHLFAFLMAGGVAISLMRVRNSFHGYVGIIADIYIAIASISFIHLWELLAENWNIIHVPYNVGELVERIIWVPVFIFILYAFTKLRRMSKSITTPPSDNPPATLPEPETTPFTPQAAELPKRKIRIAIAIA